MDAKQRRSPSRGSWPNPIRTKGLSQGFRSELQPKEQWGLHILWETMEMGEVVDRMDRLRGKLLGRTQNGQEEKSERKKRETD